MADVFPLQVTRAVCNVLAQTEYPGLSGSELRELLHAAKLNDLAAGPNKRTQLLTTLHNAQVERKSGSTLIAYLNAAMDPLRYADNPARFYALQAELNAVLVLAGFRVNDAGQMATARLKAKNLTEAAELAGVLAVELRRRGCHPTVMRYCSEELLRRSLFHAIGEAAKSIPDRLRRHTGLGLDGEDLFTAVFGSKNATPKILINAYRSDSEQAEHRGFKNLLTGIHGHYRNPRAHNTRLGSSESETDFYDAFALFSYVHRRLDSAAVAV